MARIILTIGVALLLLAFSTAGCGSIDSDLVGVWECTETTSPTNDVGRLFKLTDDGRMGTADQDVSFDDINLPFEYEASRGSLTYWYPDHADVQHTVSYTIDGDVLEIPSTGGLQGKWKRVQ